MAKRFSTKELISMASSVLLIAMVLTFPVFGVAYTTEELFRTFITVLLAASIYFLVKQPAHKIAADKFQCTSTFKLWPMGIFATAFTILLKITALNFPILLPGYTEILPYKFGRKGIKLISLTPRDSGTISLAGIGAALLVAMAFTLFPSDTNKVIANTLAILVIYDLLPFTTSDGGRIFTWHIFIWLVLILAAGIVFIV